MGASTCFTITPKYDNITSSNNTTHLLLLLCRHCRDRWLRDLCAEAPFNGHDVNPLGRGLQCTPISPHSRVGKEGLLTRGQSLRYGSPHKAHHQGIDSPAIYLYLTMNLTLLRQSPPDNHLNIGKSAM